MNQFVLRVTEKWFSVKGNDHPFLVHGGRNRFTFCGNDLHILVKSDMIKVFKALKQEVSVIILDMENKMHLALVLYWSIFYLQCFTGSSQD